MAEESSGTMSLEAFRRVHASLLLSSGVPLALHDRLFEKLSAQAFDAGDWFQVESTGRGRRVVLAPSGTHPGLTKEGDIFLVDHAWTFRLQDARKQLESSPALAQRMAALMGVDDEALGWEAGDEDDESPAQEAEEDKNPGGRGGQVGDSDPAGKPESSSEKPSRAAEEAEELVRAAEATAVEHDGAAWLELDNLGLLGSDIEALQLSSRFQNLVALSLWGNNLEASSSVRHSLTRLTSLKGLWLNGNPCAQDAPPSRHWNSFLSSLLDALPNLELLNSRFTPLYGTWALGFACGACSPEDPCPDKGFGDVVELDLPDRGISQWKSELLNPEAFPALQSLDLRGNKFEEETAESLVLALAAFSGSLTSLKVDVPGPLGATASEVLQSLPFLDSVNGLAAVPLRPPGSEALGGTHSRSIKSLKRELSFQAGESLVQRVLDAMWQHAMHYRLATEEKLDESAVWYIMDEFGSAFGHSDTPNFTAAPFLFLPDGTLASGISYTVVWPTKDVPSGAECTRDFLPGSKGQAQRWARLLTWFSLPQGPFSMAHEQRERFLDERCKHPSADRTAPAALPATATATTCQEPPSLPLKVFTDLPQVSDTLTRPEFSFVDSPAEADILWISVQVDDTFWREAGMPERREGSGMAHAEGPFVNQFPYEACLVMKHHLAKTVQQAYGRVSWLQDTFDLESELDAFAGCFLAAEAESFGSQTSGLTPGGTPGEAQGMGDEVGKARAELNGWHGSGGRPRSVGGNTWILKPWNMARSIDSTVVYQLPQILRMSETGPKICQRYIAKPALFKGRKFDLRFFVLLRGLQPLDAFVSDVFWSRVANHSYSTDVTSLSDFETHFTVMNYLGKGPLEHIPTHEFVRAFEEEHEVSWADIDARIRQMLRELLLGAAAVHPEMAGERALGGQQAAPGNVQTSGSAQASGPDLQGEEGSGLHGCRYRALYGVDVMLDCNFKPKLLEVTYCPDCARACKYDMRSVRKTGAGGEDWIRAGQFFNDVFGCLFLGEEKHVTRL